MMRIQITLPKIYAVLALTLSPAFGDSTGLFTGEGADTHDIVGGEEATPGRYNHTVALWAGYQFCGGSLIAPDTVLTAAHCMDGSSFNVIINRHDLRTSDGESIVRKMEITHPNYNENTMANDFALVFLERGTTEKVDFVKLNQDDTYPADGSTSRAMGWGTTSSGGTASNVLLEVDLPVISNQECDTRYPQETIFNNNICTFQPGKDSCQGDSGGPLIMPGTNAAEDKLIGIVSWGYGCATSQYPGVYARVSNQIEWIKANVCKYSSFPPADLCMSGGTYTPTKQSTPKPTTSPVTNEPTSTAAAAFSMMETGGYCLDGSDQWYSAFKSSPLPVGTTDSYCLNWCAAISRTDLVAVETYTDNSNLFCYCDFPGGQVPQDISLSDFDPDAGKIITYPGDGPVISTDSVQGASCYINTNFMRNTAPPTTAPSSKPTTISPTNAPSRKPSTKSPTQAPSLKPTTESATNAPSSKPSTKSPTSAPSRKPTTKSPTNAPSRKPSTKSPTQAPSRKPTTESPTNAPSSKPSTKSPTQAPTKVPVTPSSSPSASPVTSTTTTTTTATTVNPPPTDPSVSPKPSAHPSSSPTALSTDCYPRATLIKIQSTTGQQINMFEVKAISSSGLNVALQGSASQSSTLKGDSKFEASNAIDNREDGAFAHTDDSSAWWQVTLDVAEEIKRIVVSNRYCRDTNDSPGCLCRLSDAKVLLFDTSGSIIHEESFSNTCGSQNIVVEMTKSFSCSPETPSPAPSVVNLPKARYVKLHSITGAPIQVEEVEVYNSAFENIAIGKAARQSSTLNAFTASLAIDGKSSFSHTNSNDSSAMWEVDLGGSESIKSIRIINRYCVNPSDPKGCLCRLSFTMLSLFDGDGNWISTTNIGGTCNKLEWNYDFSNDDQSICDTWM